MEESLRICDSEQYRLQGVEMTGRTFGSGTTADVMEVRFIGLTCVAKKFHFTKHPGYKAREVEYSKRYLEHCSLLGKLRHPNLVQFIGYYCEPDSLTPILVYEYVHMTLANCLENYGPLPDSMNYSVLKDVAMALRYLHELTTPIAHDSLSASKILLTRDMSAKLGDVGMASITEMCQLSPVNSTDTEMCFVPSGNDTCILPSEGSACFMEQKLRNDVYAYGLLMIHIITGRSWLSEIKLAGYTQSVSMCESDMVEILLNNIHDGHILLELLEKCLSTDPALRPSAITVLHKITQVSSNYPPLFTNSLEMLQKIQTDTERQMSLSKLTPENSIEISSPNNELDRLKSLVRKMSTQNIVLQAKLSSKSNSLNYDESPSPTSRGLMRQDNQCITSPLHIRQGHINWTECSNMPVGMFQGQAVYLKGSIYVGGGNTGSSITDALVFEYNIQKDVWSPLPPTYVSSFGLCKLEGELIMVGGIVAAKVIGSVALFDSFTKRWKDSLPPLAMERQSPSCISVRSAIIVCGGVSPTGELLTSIEVMKSDTFQWYTAGYLPRSAMLCHSSAVAVHDSLYLLGGYKSSTANSSTSICHSSSVDMLLSYSGMTPYTWTPVPNTPHFQSTAACIGSCFLSLGGTSSAYTEPVHQSIYGFSCSANAWIYAGDLPYGFCHGMTVSLPNNEFYVMGGWIQPGKSKRSAKMYKGSVMMK